MSARRNWQEVQGEVLRRLHAREWAPGDLIPNEADLAAEFGCARTTVNRALRAVADAGLLDRRRKAGTRVAVQPAARATFEIALIRQEVEGAGRAYGYRLIARREAPAPATVRAAMGDVAGPMLHLVALHLADGAPFALEDRWIDIGVVPGARTAPFDVVSGNEWLLTHAPFTHGEIAFSAADASGAEAGALGVATGSGVLAVERVTWDGGRAVTAVRITYPGGHRLRTRL